MCFFSISLVSAQISDFDTRPYKLSEPLVGEDNHDYIRIADSHLARYDLIKALDALDLAVTNTQDNATAYLKRALVKQLLGMNEQAAQDFNAANQINPYIADLMGYNGKGGTLSLLAFEPQSYMLSIDWKARLHYYFDLLKNDKIEPLPSKEEREQLKKILVAYQEDQRDIFTLIERTLSNFPESFMANDLAGVYFLQNKQLERADNYLQKGVQYNDSFALGWYNLGLLEQQRGNIVQAIQYFDKAILLQSDLSKVYFNKALAYKKLGNREKAIEAYDEIVSLSDDNLLEALVNRGLTKKMMGDFNGALIDFEEAIQIDARNPDLYKNRGNLYLIFGHIPDAIIDYTKALELKDNYAEVFYNRGLAYLKFHRPFFGCEDIRQSADLGYELAIQRESYFCKN